MAQNLTLWDGSQFNNVPSVKLPKTGGGLAEFFDVGGSQSITSNGTYDVTTLAEVDVNVSGGGGTSLVPGILRGDAELVQEWTYDKLIHADEGVTIPSYTTNQQTLKTYSNLTATLDQTTYDYILTYQLLAYPIYNRSTKGKARQEYHVRASLYEFVSTPLVYCRDGSVQTTNRLQATISNDTQRLVYFSSATALGIANTGYGVFSAYSTSPSLSGTTLTIPQPTLYIRGSTSYLNSTYWGYMTDIRYQSKIQLHRVGRTSKPYGWQENSLLVKLLDDAQSSSGTIT